MNAPAPLAGAPHATPQARRSFSTGEVEVLEIGDGPELVLLLHAAAQNPRAMAGLAKRLAGPHRRILVPHLGPPPGAARAGAAATHGNPIRAYAALASACLREVPAERRVLVGHSMGALTALLAAAEGAPHDRLVLYEPIVTAMLSADDPEDLALRKWDAEIVVHLEGRIAAGDPEPGVAGFVEAWNEIAWGRIPPPARARMVADAPELARLVRATSDFPLDRAMLAALPAPVTVLQGGASPPVTRRMSERLAAALPAATLQVLDGCGHMGPVLQADAVAESVEAMLAPATD
ncbi:alpha/beta fold hydrolase [Marinibaculum pumilum]|uniref:Alpha/beta fold hydrolase n=1 Tax=Marinibaculum pumilum TaxID=1766165 RepID=A0ABV7L0T6_9PROT